MSTDTNIWLLISDGMTDEALAMIDSGAVSVDEKDDYGYTPLMAAVSYNNIALCRRLLELGANLEARDQRGATPLHYAECLEAFEFLKAAGADLTAVDSAGQSPIESYIFTEDLDFVADLLLAGHFTKDQFTLSQDVYDELARLLPEDKLADLLPEPLDTMSPEMTELLEQFRASMPEGADMNQVMAALSQILQNATILGEGDEDEDGETGETGESTAEEADDSGDV
ncbi:hypothetical protein H696_03153 [Fonticula alba]|uniref:Uncharacterized protein n=1 Tax=Fonticula alba TaxID=691883 RepID=A0A058ZBJ9_FONAL|nr:hypothetical protein H696_03153 [Fonticula alba]KCV70802.1 hypothetical protein H696_03153 [Fonticula alba]|eukprot:XP_009495318.1 hypothetical protein H696_03153 [Fonticula alba]